MIINNPAPASGGGGSPLVSIGLVATGTNVATALQLTTGYSFVDTVGAGTGVKLPVGALALECTVVNHGAGALSVYPLATDTIDITGSAAVVVPAGCTAVFVGKGANTWGNSTVAMWDAADTNFSMPAHASIPAVPAANAVSLFIKNIGGRLLPAFRGPSGIDSALQPHWGRNRTVYWQPLGNATTVPITTGIAAATTVGTATARNVATTNIATRTKRLGYVSASTAGSLAGHYFAVAQYTTGTGAGLGGFTYMCRVVVSDASAVSGARMFIGMSSNTGAPTNVEPSTLTNSFGFAQLSTSNTQWYFVYGGSAAQTAIALGTGLGAPTLTNTVWDIAIFASPGSAGQVSYSITNLSSGVSVSGTIASNAGVQTPVSTLLLAPRAWRCNNATAAAVGLDIASLYLETDQ